MCNNAFNSSGKENLEEKNHKHKYLWVKEEEWKADAAKEQVRNSSSSDSHGRK